MHREAGAFGYPLNVWGVCDTTACMLSVFCLRLALGMLATLVFLSPRRMHPRFFRTRFLTALGLCVVALMMAWTTSTEEYLLRHHSDLPTGSMLRRSALIVAVVATLLGALVWIFEKPPAGWVLLGV